VVDLSIALLAGLIGQWVRGRIVHHKKDFNGGSKLLIASVKGAGIDGFGPHGDDVGMQEKVNFHYAAPRAEELARAIDL